MGNLPQARDAVIVICSVIELDNQIQVPKCLISPVRNVVRSGFTLLAASAAVAGSQALGLFSSGRRSDEYARYLAI